MKINNNNAPLKTMKLDSLEEREREETEKKKYLFVYVSNVTNLAFLSSEKKFV